ncbi:dTMP kinase [Sorangium sp. So ce1024]|uniref:dTMP kinase n=1 Tax=Sorangium sp. So ce1024 TaxID=3133327 RepID=UPI003F072B3B
MTGYLVIVEGGDGAGKSTQAARLVSTLCASGRRAVLEREPTDGPIGRLIREMTVAGARPDPKTIALLFAADRQEHARRIQALLDEGVIVVCDRYALSTAVYQGATSGSLTVERWADGLSMFACPPDIIVVLTASLETCAARLRERGRPADAFEVDDFQRRVHRAYANARDYRWGRSVRFVDAERTPELVARSVLTEVERRIAAGPRTWPAERA